MPEYTDIVLAARSAALPDLSATLRLRLARLLVRELDAVYVRLAAGELTEDAAAVYIDDLTRALERYMRMGDVQTKAVIRDMLDTITEAHVEATARTMGQPAQGVRAVFAGVPTEAFEQLFLRRAMGLTQSYKTLSAHSARASAQMVEEALSKGILRGDSFRTVAAGIARGLANGDPYLEKVVERYGLEGGLKAWAREAGETLDEDAVAVARKLGHDAKRIARTEMAMAYHEADRVSSMRSPVVGGLKWHLSPLHPHRDVCDVYAKADLYGMGPGVFPPEKIPPKSHPHCLCFNTFVLRPEAEWNDPKPDAPRPVRVDRAEVARHMQGASGRALDRAFRQVLRDTASEERRRAA